MEEHITASHAIKMVRSNQLNDIFSSSSSFRVPFHVRFDILFIVLGVTRARLNYNYCSRLRECCRQVEAEVACKAKEQNSLSLDGN